MFTEKDIKQIEQKGITKEQVIEQFNQIKSGNCFSNLVSSASIGIGIEVYNKTEIDVLIKYYRAKKENCKIVKFTPASGAASRMFKFLFKFLRKFNPYRESVSNYFNRTEDKDIENFISNLEKFPFYEAVVEKLKSRNPNIHSLTKGQLYIEFVKTMLDDDTLNYSFLPKGLLPFHKYGKEVITAFQEHLFESTLYASSKGKANLHFTVSEEHYNCFKAELNRIKSKLEASTNTVFDVSFSFQSEATEVIALTSNNNIFRKQDDSILFRPGGHGALLENLNALDADLIFIKNIDNITVSELNIDLSKYKELLAGVLLKAQDQIFKFLTFIDAAKVSHKDLNNMVTFLSEHLNIVLGNHFEDLDFESKITEIREKLNRPIRACGMVKNEGEPGGGPFWVKDNQGNVSLQIVEFAQIDCDNESQAEIAHKALYFSPTDVVCGVKNHKGEKYDLTDFVDPNAVFLSDKTINGIDIKVLELPGLWNGSMAHWNSIFVEVPAETFNPVKTVNDLLRPAHQVDEVVKKDLAV